MSRRLSEMSEEALETGGRSARKAVEEAGFSDDLKRELEERIANAGFRSANAQAFAQVNLPSSAGAGTKHIAGAAPWAGVESTEDAALRMLNDAHKPIRAPARPPSIRMPTKVDTGRSRSKEGGSGTRLASARDKSSVYSFLKDPNMDEQERENIRKQLKERFTPGARAVPATIQGLASLANERIEDAIARGQFKNLPRGKQIERDYNASSPFLDTTEYFMNKIIKKQDIVPPWIEKQQELTSTSARFRAQLRNQWRRHVARLIASRGGPLESQLALATEYARAEALSNPPRAKAEPTAAGDQSQPQQQQHMSQISLAGVLNAAADPAEVDAAESPPPPPPPPTVAPFRDPAWVAAERAYHVAAVENLNALARSYNLMAPNLARKPYFNLDRELKACYADVAPQVGEEIRVRAAAPVVKVEVIGHREGGVMQRFAGAGPSRVFDERKPKYGFKEFWRDLFTKN
ncbi:hypothetical protein K461DRAFT_266082 [Myriangium duriaei CBS 260.36]|uniref:DnaJ homologue subfamily C member 28 conserved domain-containing protein n=1 Tax=Myriangium duriaei CBS 260.36 TaxID=1168546 RepID=A0A9P4J772_9PEZI|nr:hypothetical protein K461DRAFT_266082 [Myriangium duriaei CBS 260.36]